MVYKSFTTHLTYLLNLTCPLRYWNKMRYCSRMCRRKLLSLSCKSINYSKNKHIHKTTHLIQVLPKDTGYANKEMKDFTSKTFAKSSLQARHSCMHPEWGSKSPFGFLNPHSWISYHSPLPSSEVVHSQSSLWPLPGLSLSYPNTPNIWTLLPYVPGPLYFLPISPILFLPISV